MKKIFISIFLFLSLTNTFSEENTKIVPNKKLIPAAWKTASIISPQPIKLEVVFDKSFIQKIGEEKLIKTLKEVYKETGSIIKISTVSFLNEYHGEFFFHSERDYILPVSLAINSNGKVIFFSFRPVFKQTKSTSDIVEKIKNLEYEKKGLIIKKLTQIEDTLYSLNENDIFSISSAFSLYLIAWLAENEKKWDKVIRVKEKSLPYGTISKYPQNAPITIFSLAYHMITENDNTATDLLIDYITREKLEKYISQHILNYALNLPFLKTIEAAKIRSDLSIAQKYSTLSYTQKIEVINSLRKIDLKNLNSNSPAFTNSVGWFATPSELCKILDYLRSLNNPFVNSILENNQPLDTKRGGYLWAGFKGGYEPGIITLNWLVQAKDNRYYCISITINDSKKDINKKEILEISQELLDVFANE